MQVYSIFTNDKNLILWILCIFVIYRPVLASEIEKINPNVRFEHITIKEGLSENTVLSIHQDHFGFMWFGTRNGLNKFDGYDFKIFSHEVGNSSSLAGDVINDIVEDKNGNLWLATEKGLSKYIRDADTFKNFIFYDSYKKTMEIKVIFIDNNDSIWIGGVDGLYLFNEEKNLYEKKYASHNLKMVNTIQSDAKGNIIIGTGDFGIYEIQLDQETLSPLIDKKDFPSIRSRVESIAITNTNEIWVGTYGDGLFLLDKEGKLKSHYFMEAKNTSFNLSNNYIRSLQLDEEDNLWVGTFSGLNIIKNDQVIHKLFHVKGNLNSLSHNSIRSIMKDTEGTIWIGTYFGGINVYDKKHQQFQHFYNIPGDQNSLSYNVVGAFEEFNDSSIIIGTERGGINIVTKIGNHSGKGAPQFASTTIKSLYIDKDENIWAGVFKAGLYMLDKKTASFTTFPHVNDSTFRFLSRSIINTIVPDDYGSLWLATDDRGGLYRFNISSKQFELYPYQKELHDFIGNTPVKDITIVQDHIILLATKGKGIIVFNTKTGVLDQIKKDLEFNHVFEDSRGNLWLSSNGEGVFLKKKDGKLRQFHSGNGLVGNIVLGTLEDSSHDLWFICSKGLSRMNGDSVGNFKNYSSHLNFPIEEINEGAFFKSKSGEFFIGGSNGYVRFFPQYIVPNHSIPPLAFTFINISNKEVKPGDTSNILDKNLNSADRIILKHNQSIFSIGFAALNYIHPENNQYAYKLEGFDDRWIMSGTKREATYTAIPQGKYTFKVKGSNNDQIWNPQSREIEILVLPPPWKTWWAYSLYGLFLLGIFLLLRKNTLKRIYLRHRLQMEKFEKEKWKEFHDLKSQYFIDVSHEFKTPLTLIMAPLEEIMEHEIKNKEVRSKLNIVYYNTRRLKLLIEQILDIRSLETGHTVLDPEPHSLSIILQDIKRSFMPTALKKGVQLILQDHIDPGKLQLLDQDKIQKIFYNLLSNAIKHTPEGGEIILSVKNKGTRYHFEIRDTGEGMSDEVMEKIFTRFYKNKDTSVGTGLGLTLTKSLVEIIGGTITVDSMEGEGTTFRIDLSFEESTVIPTNILSDKSYQTVLPLFGSEDSTFFSQTSEGDSRRENLLIIEDNHDLRNYIKQELSPDYNVFTAENGKIGLSKAQKIEPSLIVSDLMMPKMDGLELLQKIKSNKELNHIPVILLTAKDSQKNKIDGLEQGADDYLTKPFHVKELKARIHNIISNRNLLHEKYKSSTFLPDLSEITFNSYDEKLLTDIVQIMKDNLDNSDLNVEFLADKTGLSRVHLYRKLKALTGMSPTDFIIDFRIKSACKMLKTRKYRVSEVAYAVGYQDPQYFSKSFKKKTGISPSKYRTNEK